MSTEPDRKAPSRLRRLWRPLLTLVALALVVGYGVTQWPAAVDAANHLAGVRPVYLIGGVLAEAAALLCYAMLTRAVLPYHGRPSFWTLLRIDLSSLSASHVLPGGDVTAATLRFHWLHVAGVRRTDAVFGATLQGVGSAIVLNVILGIALLVSIPTHGGDPLYNIAAGVAAALIIAAGGVVLGLTRGRAWVERVVRAIAARIPRVQPETAERQVRRVAEDLRAFASNRGVLLSAIGWASLNWLLDAASLWIFLAAFGYHAGVEGLLIAFGLANVLASIPITPGGLGVVEGILIPTLVGFGAPYGVAVVGVISYRLVNFWLPIPIGGLTYLSLRAGPLRSTPTTLHPASPSTRSKTC